MPRSGRRRRQVRIEYLRRLLLHTTSRQTLTKHRVHAGRSSYRPTRFPTREGPFPRRRSLLRSRGRAAPRDGLVYSRRSNALHCLAVTVTRSAFADAASLGRPGSPPVRLTARPWVLRRVAGFPSMFEHVGDRHSPSSILPAACGAASTSPRRARAHTVRLPAGLKQQPQGDRQTACWPARSFNPARWPLLVLRGGSRDLVSAQRHRRLLVRPCSLPRGAVVLLFFVQVESAGQPRRAGLFLPAAAQVPTKWRGRQRPTLRPAALGRPRTVQNCQPRERSCTLAGLLAGAALRWRGPYGATQKD